MFQVECNCEAEIWAKGEYLNPGGSIKDRVALHMIERAEARGELKPGAIIVEPSSGNTGISVTLVGVQKGYRVIIAMPEDMSEERKKIIRACGGELELTPAAESLEAASLVISAAACLSCALRASSRSAGCASANSLSLSASRALVRSWTSLEPSPGGSGRVKLPLT